MKLTSLANFSIAISLGCLATSAVAQSSTTTVTAVNYNGDIGGSINTTWSGDCNEYSYAPATYSIFGPGPIGQPEGDTYGDWDSSVAGTIFGPGSYQFTGTFSGFGGFTSDNNPCTISSSSGSAGVTVPGPVPSSVSASTGYVRENQPVSITVGVTGLNYFDVGPTPTGTVVLFYGSTVLTTGQIEAVQSQTSEPAAGLTLNLSTMGIAPGSYNYAAVYNGDSNFSPASVKGTVTITPKQVPSSTVLSISPASSTAGENVTLTASVTPSVPGPTPTGRVVFLYGKTSLGIATLNSQGVGSLILSNVGIPPGTYSVVASYSGDAYDSPSLSTPQSETIQPPPPAMTTTLLNCSPCNVSSGQSITFTASVARVGSSGLPTGIVSFGFDSYEFGNAKLNAQGVATLPFSTKNLGSGSYSINATYSGDSQDMGSTSPSITVTVQ